MTSRRWPSSAMSIARAGCPRTGARSRSRWPPTRSWSKESSRESGPYPVCPGPAVGPRRRAAVRERVQPRRFLAVVVGGGIALGRPGGGRAGRASRAAAPRTAGSPRTAGAAGPDGALLAPLAAVAARPPRQGVLVLVPRRQDRDRRRRGAGPGVAGEGARDARPPARRAARHPDAAARPDPE